MRPSQQLPNPRLTPPLGSLDSTSQHQITPASSAQTQVGGGNQVGKSTMQLHQDEDSYADTNAETNETYLDESEPAHASKGVLEEVETLLSSLFHGMIEAFAWSIPVLMIFRSSVIRLRTFQCLLLNGIIFLGSIFLFNSILWPMFKWLLANPFLFYNKPTTLMTLDDADRLSHGTEQEVALSPLLQHAFDAILFGVYHAFWVYPIYCFSFILNSIWHQEIADEAYLLQVRRRAPAQTSYDQVVRKMADEIFRMIVFLVFLIQATLISIVPVVGPYLSFICVSWLYAFYSFEYKWIHKGWSLDRRLDYFERHWAYFAGFGFPFTLFTFFFPQFVSAGIFALLFPMYIIMAMAATPLPRGSGVGNIWSLVPPHLPIFSLSKRIALAVLRQMKINPSQNQQKTSSKLRKN